MLLWNELTEGILNIEKETLLEQSRQTINTIELLIVWHV